jgi:RHS repeat-associated protein
MVDWFTRAHRRGARRRNTLTGLLVWPVVATLAVAIVGQQPVSAAKPKPTLLSAQKVASVDASPVVPRRPAAKRQPAARPPIRVVWPAAGSATVDVAGGASAHAGTLPVWVTGSTRPASSSSLSAAGLVSRVRVDVLGRGSVPAGWRNGVVLRVARVDGGATAGRASVSVDYSRFAGAFGGDYASRLRLVALPECALSAVEAARCGATPLVSSNDLATKRVTADVTVAGAGGTVVALTAGASGSSGNFTATSLRPSSSWSAGGNSGDFSWQYPMATPPGLGGPEPTVALSYSSQSVDGRNETTNNQPGWIGEGFDFWPGYIERSYKPCADDKSGGNNSTDTGDLCWGTDNAVLSMSGRGGQLVKDGSSGAWRLKDDDNTKIEHLTGANNGDSDGEYWRLTTADGTQYYFGLNRLSGYTGTAPANRTTDSAWTEPVAGNQAGEPCNGSTFAGSFCAQAWRWNLDYVVDPQGNTMSIFYQHESNNYASNGTDTAVKSYYRGGWVDHIDYGTDNRSGTDTDETAAAAPMRVQFGTADRCLSDCGTHDVAHWPDTPWDQSCTSSTSCPGLYSPTFWVTKRLSSVTTQVWDTAAGKYKDVDLWTLSHSNPPSGDDTRDGMWLDSVVHTGKATGSGIVDAPPAQPATTFAWTQLANRVDTLTDHKPPMNWMRLSTINTDTGEKIDIRYLDQQCIAGTTMPASEQSNTLRCYPVKEEQPDKSIKTEYFNKYPVKQVTESDLTGGGPDVTTAYEYIGSPAWRHADDDGMTKDNLRTWSDYRGYPQVNVRVGQIDGGQQTLTETKYFQGMNGDLNGSGGTRSVSLPAVDVNGDGSTTGVADAPAVPDEEAYSGRARQSTVYNGVESDPVSTTVNQPWQSEATASRDMGDTNVYARHTGTAATWSGTKLAAGGWRVTRSDTAFDSYGMATQEDAQGDVAATGDEKCTTTAYARNTDTNLLQLTGEVDVYALRCAQVASPGPATDADIVSISRSLYDHHAYGTAPTGGLVTETDVAKAWAAGVGLTWLTQSTSSYDPYGRATDVTDVRGNHTTTVYTPSSGPVTKTAVTTPLGTTTTTMEPSWGSPTTVLDNNNKQTDVRYDALGRTKQVWLANHPIASYPTQPNSSYDYLVRNAGGVNAVTTRTLNGGGGYTTSIALFDGMLRARQTQSISAADDHKGTVFADTQYDKAGRAYRQQQYFDANVQPSTTLYGVPAGASPTQTDTVYDRAGRATAQVFISKDHEQWRTTTGYGGDRVNVTPPAGGIATTTVTDALGRTTAMRQYHNPADVGSNTSGLFDQVTYHYNRKGQQDSWSDNAGNTWTAGFDLLGRQTASHDPDKGDSTSKFNDLGDLTSTKDGRGQNLAYAYDNLGRKTFEYAGTDNTGTKLAAWTYDPTGAKGHPASSSRFVGTDEYRVTVDGYDSLYHPLGAIYLIPSSQGAPAGSFEMSRTYNVDGSPDAVVYPFFKGVYAETITYRYDATSGLPTSLETNFPSTGKYVSKASYTAYGELSAVAYQTTGAGLVQRGLTYDDVTRRLTEAKTTRQASPTLVQDTSYQYDPTGNVTKVVDTSATGAVDTQCFGYDYARRLTDAWTPLSGDCRQAKSASALSGPAPYWSSWSFDAAGDRKTQTNHTTAGDITATSMYPASGANSVRPHAVASIATSGGGVSHTDNYSYDGMGDTTARPGPTAAQTVNWDAEGHVSKVTENGKDTTYIYDADGNRLTATDSTKVTLYLPGEELVHSIATDTISTTRYYDWAGQTCAMFSNGTGSSRLTWLITDQQGTQQTEIDNGSEAVTQRRQTPYGAPRGTNPTWLNPHGFVGGIADLTGLTHEGAREYDPGTGRFISVDPLFDSKNPQSWQGYAYAENNPTSGSDPTGMRTEEQYYGKAGSASMEEHDDAKAQALADQWGSHRGCAREPTECGTQKYVPTRNPHKPNIFERWRHYVAVHGPNALERYMDVRQFFTNLPSTITALNLAFLSNSSCGMSGWMVACKGSGLIPPGRAGFTLGNVYIAKDPADATEMQHEYQHARQDAFWYSGNPITYTAGYIRASELSLVIHAVRGDYHDPKTGKTCSDWFACYNVFERNADLDKGNYEH